MGQATLASFTGQDLFHDPTKKPPVYDCQNCTHFRGFVQGPAVRCIDGNREIPKNGCSCWSDGKELEFRASIAPPKDFVAKKYAGGRA